MSDEESKASPDEAAEKVGKQSGPPEAAQNPEMQIMGVMMIYRLKRYIGEGLALLTLAALLTACSLLTGAPITPDIQTSFYKAEAGYTAALVTIGDYTALPRCGDGAPPLCSSQSVVDQLRDAANTADRNVQYAEDLVRAHPNVDASFAMDAANKAYQSLLGIMATYHVGPVPAD